ncbi:ATP synthase F1 subunit delta [Acholeplasma sp. OttesenSCG-928-E16]|nr:ATP synthase F1 subunit delta [Acholeplasma sp. OttesenSCG-928-E16]
MSVFNYAKALFDIALEEKKIDIIVEQMDKLYQSIKGNEYILVLLSSPVSLDEKKNKLKEIASFDNLMMEFLLTLCKNGTILDFKEIHKEWLKLSDDYRKIAYVRVYSAKKLSDNQLALIKNELTPYLKGLKIEIDAKIDKKAIGGIRIEYKDTTLDKTIKNLLEEMKNAGD